MKKESLDALGAVPATPEDLPEELLNALNAEGISVHKIPKITGPKIIHQGRYRLYEKPDGSLRIQYRRDDKDEDDFFEVPGEFISLGKQMETGKMSPMQFIQAGMRLVSKMRV